MNDDWANMEGFSFPEECVWTKTDRNQFVPGCSLLIMFYHVLEKGVAVTPDMEIPDGAFCDNCNGRIKVIDSTSAKTGEQS
jgi:hypothetical protein